MFGSWRAHFTLFSVMKLLVDTFTITTAQEYTKKHVRFFCKLWGFSLTKHLHVSASFYLTTPYTLYQLYAEQHEEQHEPTLTYDLPLRGW